MFRTAILRSARGAARSVTRWQAPIARPVVPTLRAQSRQQLPAACFQAVRCYSAGGALNRDEAEGRILDLLKNFDKVCALERSLRQASDLANAHCRFKTRPRYCIARSLHRNPMLTQCSFRPLPTFPTTSAWTAWTPLRSLWPLRRSSASRYPTRMPTRSTAVCSTLAPYPPQCARGDARPSLRA